MKQIYLKDQIENATRMALNASRGAKEHKARNSVRTNTEKEHHLFVGGEPTGEALPLTPNQAAKLNERLINAWANTGGPMMLWKQATKPTNQTKP